ncbi:ribosome biogenesis GTPase YqeH [Kroppenstedtia eburnea]|uniref:ribosome biogenesis GTPase YqeH n=1 Tax=Kroppenstedtia eburnea TaxID=714067 RepID=UPI00020C8C3B|nr:GTP-binding protein [Desmospora sp. 8437]
MMEQEIGCEGCGVPLQTEHPEKPGYVPPAALEREHPICKRCFRIRHYNEVAQVEHDPDAYLAMLGEIGNRQALVVQVVDLFDLSGSWIPGIQRHTGGNPILILGNKLDLFPKSAKVQRLKEWVYHTVSELGVKPVDVVLTSAAKGVHFDEVARAIETCREGRDVFVTGTANVGKSTLINRLLKEFGSGEEVITTSPYPGTTLDTIHIPLEGGRELVDMPGIVRRDRMSEWVAPDELGEITPKSEIKPKVYQLNDGQTLFFGGLARMDYSEGVRQPFVCHMANSLYIHRTKLAHADEVWEKHRGELLSPPKDPSSLPPLVRHTFHLDGKQKQDLVISGLGWIATGKERARVELWVPRGVRVEVRPAIL